jgi:predicted amidohydrolase YtcJ
MWSAMHADTVLRDGVLHTLNAARSRARSVAIAGGRIVAFDDDAEAAIRAGTRVENLEAALHDIAQAAPITNENVWIQGRGWDRNCWGRLPTAAELDTVTRLAPHRPGGIVRGWRARLAHGTPAGAVRVALTMVADALSITEAEVV